MEFKEPDLKAIARADRKAINKNFKHLKFIKDGVLIPDNNLHNGVSDTAWYGFLAVHVGHFLGCKRYSG